MKLIPDSFSSSASLLERSLVRCAALCRKLWSSGRRLHRASPDHLCQISRLSLAHGGAVSVVEFESERFLIATSSKGHISMLTLSPSQSEVAGRTRPQRRPANTGAVNA